MDITFKTSEGVFNYRVTALIIHDNKLLAMNDVGTNGYYLPGGRVKLHETLIDALKRELKEELYIDANIVRPLFINENFFKIKEKKYHELGVYYLVDISNTDILSKGNEFEIKEDSVTHLFKWLDIDSLENELIFPLFIRTKLKKIEYHIQMIVDKD